jgi:hypothetical protein
MKKVLSLLVAGVLITAVACNSTTENKTNTDSLKAANAADSVKKAADAAASAAPKMDTAAAKMDTAAKKMDKMDKKK